MSLQAFFAQKPDESVDVFELTNQITKQLKAGDEEWNQAYHALFQFRIMPWEFAKLSDKERAFVVAACKFKNETELKNKGE